MTEENLEQKLKKKREELIDREKKSERERIERMRQLESIQHDKYTASKSSKSWISKKKTGLTILVGALAIASLGILFKDNIRETYRSITDVDSTEVISLIDSIPFSIPKYVNSEHTIPAGTYDVDHSIIVSKNGTLNLLEDVIINFKNPYNGIIIKGGELNILGKKSHPVILDAKQNSLNGVEIEYWRGIVLEESKKDNVIEYATIRRAQNRKSGAGIHARYSTLRLDNSTIEQCIVTKKEIGGGMLNEFSDVSIKGSKIIENIGSGIYNTNSTVKVENTIIANNVSGYQGGGIFNSYSKIDITASTITGNTAKLGGGIYNTNSEIRIDNTAISSNTAERNGSGIYNRKSTNFMKNVLMPDNNNLKDKNIFGRAQSLYSDSESKIMQSDTDNGIIHHTATSQKSEVKQYDMPAADKNTQSASNQDKSTTTEKTIVQSTPTIETKVENTDTKIASEPKLENHTIDTITDNKSTNEGNAYTARAVNSGNDSRSGSIPAIHRPEINHTYIINDSTFYCNNRVGYGSDLYFFILTQPGSQPLPKNISTERFSRLYNEGKVKDLGSTMGKRNLIYQMQEAMKRERSLRR